ncbi:transcriptional regulator, RpiR family [Candidatus Koribacter versatilis Ellin345]|uniref:Transcriptional regulator, RpiR family n=1 Tax=Koribacter versatilis (strain Ellin345) TaxID=204669 RepID=Q1IJW8_KORVE|nr:MurR/RpiR family transcriptional regulator [Candidatus Koribacter versatilis]ABF42832.1 transcriptional regulator, RpiR family [Candidatus Koribacter versatilis Ellin345]
MQMRDGKAPAKGKWRLMSQAERIAQLSPRRREIVRPAFEDPRRFVLLSVRDMADKLGTDPATMVRIAQNLGFESYKEFQHYLHELSVVRATSLDTLEASASTDSDVVSVMRACLDQELKNIRALYNGLDLEKLGTAARRMWRARRILVVGGDAATSLVSYTEYHFNVIGLPAYAATSPGVAVHAVRSLGKSDVLLAISFRRGLRMTIEAIQQARNAGAYCIGITDTYISPVARFADEFFLAGIDSNSFGVSYSAPMCLLNVFLVAIAQAQRAKTLEVMTKVAEEQSHGSRFYQE